MELLLNGVIEYRESTFAEGCGGAPPSLLLQHTAAKRLELWHKAAHIADVPDLTSRSPKAERLVARVSPDDKRTIERAAALTGQSVASFVIAHARNAAEMALERYDRIHLNAKDSRRFVEALLSTPRKAPKAVKEAFEEYRQTVREV